MYVEKRIVLSFVVDIKISLDVQACLPNLDLHKSSVIKSYEDAKIQSAKKSRSFGKANSRQFSP